MRSQWRWFAAGIWASSCFCFAISLWAGSTRGSGAPARFLFEFVFPGVARRFGAAVKQPGEGGREDQDREEGEVEGEEFGDVLLSVGRVIASAAGPSSPPASSTSASSARMPLSGAR